MVKCPQFSLVAQSCPTLCNPMTCSMPGIPVLQYLPSLLKLMSIELVMPSNHFVLCCPLLLLPSIFVRIFSNESALCIKWPKYWGFSFSISLSNEYLVLTGLISLQSKVDSQESSPAPQFESINSLVLSLPYSPTLASIHDY